jgi:GTP cyclohydrolase II
VDETSFEPIEAETPHAVIAVDRAIGDLRRGGMVLLHDGDGASLVLSSEYASAARLRRLAMASNGPVTLVLTAQRAKVLGLATDKAAGGVALTLPEAVDPARVHDLSDPTAPADPTGVRAAGLALAAADARDAAAVRLAKLSSLLPAVLTGRLDAAEASATERLLAVSAADILRYGNTASGMLNRVSAAKVPLADAPDTTIVAFRPADGGSEHLAMMIGTPAPGAPALVRIHSQCFTGDLVGSLRCDCGDQLRGAIRFIAENGGGVLLYLTQEGRGIGLVNKLRAYELQDDGLDTFEANEQLGFDADERHYQVAAEMLGQLGIEQVRLLTNNPDKIAGLERCGVAVAERVPHSFPANAHNSRYLATKAERGGHLL